MLKVVLTACYMVLGAYFILMMGLIVYQIYYVGGALMK